MPAPSKLRIDTRLTNVSIAYMTQGFVADVAMPILLVPKQAGKILEHDKSNLVIDPNGDDRIGQGEEPPVLKSDLQDKAYATFERARGATVHDDEVDADTAEDAPYEVTVTATELASARLLLNREARVATKFTTAANWAAGHNATPGTKWNAANSDPIADVDAGKKKIRDAIGVPPSHMILPWDVVQALRNNAAVKDFFKGGATVQNPAVATLAALAAIFGIPNIAVAEAGAISANMAAGFQGGTMSSLWGDNVVLFYRPASPMRRAVAAAYTYVWSGSFRGAARNARGQVITRDYHARKRTLFIDARTYSDEQILVPEAGYVLTDTLT